MKASATAKRGRDITEKFYVLVAYEDMFTHNRVREVCDRLLDQFWGEVEFDFNWWSFKNLQPEHSRELAIAAALEANLIIISAHAGPALPEHVQRWTEAWVTARPSDEGALAGLIGLPNEHGAVPIVTYLQHAAERAQMDFLPNATAATAQRPASENAVWGPKQFVTEDLKRMLDPRRPPPHWGINE